MAVNYSRITPAEIRLHHNKMLVSNEPLNFFKALDGYVESAQKQFAVYLRDGDGSEFAEAFYSSLSALRFQIEEVLADSKLRM